MSHAIFKLRAIAQDKIYPSNTLPVKIIADNIEGIYFYPTPLSQQDLIEAGGCIELEESKENKVEQLIIDRNPAGKLEHLQGSCCKNSNLLNTRTDWCRTIGNLQMRTMC